MAKDGLELETMTILADRGDAGKLADVGKTNRPPIAIARMDRPWGE